MKSVDCGGIGNRVRELRKFVGLSQEEFGKRIAMSRAGISRIESGRVFPTAQTRKSIQREFGVSDVWLESGVGQMLTKGVMEKQEKAPMLSKEDLATFYRLAAHMSEEQWTESLSIVLQSRVLDDTKIDEDEDLLLLGREGPYTAGRMNLGLTKENREWLQEAQCSRSEWPGGKTQYINWLIAQDRLKKGKK